MSKEQLYSQTAKDILNLIGGKKIFLVQLTVLQDYV